MSNSRSDLWQNSFIPLLAGIPLLVFVLFACCTCIDKTLSAARKTYLYYHCRPKTPRRVRFDFETPLAHSTPPSTSSRLSRSNTSPRLTGLMAHSSYVQKNSNYRYNSVVHTDRYGKPIQARTVLESEDKMPLLTGSHEPHDHKRSGGYHHHRPHANGPLYLNNTGGTRRYSTPASTPTANYPCMLENPLESYTVEVESQQQPRRYSTPTPTSPTPYGLSGYGPAPRIEEGRHSSISYLPEVRAYLDFMELDPTPPRQRSQSFSGQSMPLPRTSYRRSLRRPGRYKPGSRSPSPFALERTIVAAAAEDTTSNYSSPSSFGKYLTPDGSVDQFSFRSPESSTPDWLDADNMEDQPPPPEYEDCFLNLSRSSSIKTSFV